MTTVLSGVVGSTAYGLANPTSDRDVLSCHIAPVEDLLAWGHTKGQETLHGTDPDFTSHDIGKFTHLVIKGNPTVTELLWLDDYLVFEPEAQSLILHRDQMSGANAIKSAYGGYAMEQINRLMRRGDSFSADTRKRKGKHARHCLRILMQGEEFLRTGRVRIRLTEQQIETCWIASDLAATDNHEDLFRLYAKHDRAFKEAYDNTFLPAEPDREAVRRMLISIRSEALRGK